MISIVIPTYNEAGFVGKLLESLARQEINEPLEVVISDNESADRTREVAEEFRGCFSVLRIVDGGSPAVGRNRGAYISTGDPIFFIDADLELRDSLFLDRNVRYFRLRGLAAGTVRLSPLSERWVDHAIVGCYNILLAPAVFVRPLGSMCIVASRAAFEMTDGYPEDVVMAEDHDFVLRCSKVGRYRIMPVRACFDIRRLNKEGRLSLVFKYLRASMLRVFRGPITAFDYELGCFGEASSQKQAYERSKRFQAE